MNKAMKKSGERMITVAYRRNGLAGVSVMLDMDEVDDKGKYISWDDPLWVAETLARVIGRDTSSPLLHTLCGPMMPMALAEEGDRVLVYITRAVVDLGLPGVGRRVGYYLLTQAQETELMEAYAAALGRAK